MFSFIWDPRGYFFWLLCVSLLCLVLERLFPWRPQRTLRKGIFQDLFFLVFNGHYAGVLLAMATASLFSWLGQILGMPVRLPFASLNLIADQPAWLQFAVFLVLKDLLEWMIHVALHRVPWLWQFHKLHHSIRELDWIGNFRFHWMEIIVYRSLTYFPLVALGVEGPIILAIAVFATLIGHLNHANLRLDYGFLRYIFNSPRLHVWHHDMVLHGNGGQNFAIVFSAWDWLFGTIYYPTKEMPDQLGFKDMERFPRALPQRLLYPWLRTGQRTGEKG